MANSTASTIIDLARALLKTESTSSTPVIADTFLLPALSDANLRWAREFRKDGSQPIVFQRETGFDLAVETAINDTNGTTTATTTITADSTTGYDSAGVAIIWDDEMPDLFSYTSKTATTFAGVTGLAFSHEDNDTIQPLYALPSNFGSFRESPTYGDGLKVNGVPYQFMVGPPVAGYFSMYDDGTTKYLWLPRGLTGSVSVLYDKVSTVIDGLSDTVDFPTEYDFYGVWSLVAFGFAGRDSDFGRMQAAQQRANSILQSAVDDRSTHKGVRVRSFSNILRPNVYDPIVINTRIV